MGATSATGIGYGDANTRHVSDVGGQIDHNFTNYNDELITIQPGEWITLAAKAVTGTPSYVTGGLNTREDQ